MTTPADPAHDAEPERAHRIELRPGARVRQYKLVRALGEGGMGVVFEAEDERLGRHVALKFLPAHLGRNDEARQRLVNEARAASVLDHPNVCTIYEVGEAEDGRVFISMACYDGTTLRERLNEGAMPESEALDLGGQIACGLAAAHAAGIVHRDVKPSNVIITPDGLVKLVDFGIAKVSGVDLTRTGTTLGTVAYMAPEQARGKSDERSDLWSLGVLLYEMLAGHPPFASEYDGGLLFDVLYGEIDFSTLEAVSEPTREIVEGCLQRDPDERYVSAEIVHHDIEEAARQQASGAERAVRPLPRLPGATREVRQSQTPQDPAVEPLDAALPVAVPPEAALSDPASPSGAEATPEVSAAPEAAAFGGRRRWALAGGGVIVALAAIAAVVLKGSGGPAGLLVESASGAASVFVDGTFAGTTPLRLDEMEPGAIHVTVQSPGFAQAESTLTLERGRLARWPVALAPLSGDAPPAAEPLAGAPLAEAGRSLPSEVTPAAQEALSSPQRLAPMPQVPAPAPRQPQTSVQPPPAPSPAMGSLTVDVLPRGTVRVAGQQGPSGSSFSVPAGSQTVECTGPQGERFQATARVRGGQTERIACYFEAEVRVAVEFPSDVSPAARYAYLVRDGQNTAQTAPTRLTLGVGTHRIGLQRDGFTVLDGAQTVTVQPSLAPISRTLTFRVRGD